MIKFQLCLTDEYGQSSILLTSNHLSEVIKEAKDRVTDVNVNNSLTVDDKKRNWEAFFVEIPIKENRLTVYSGKNNTGKHSAYLLDEKSVSNLLIGEEDEVNIYLGNLDGKDWFATDGRGNPIKNVFHEALLGKTTYFVRTIDA